MIEKRVKDDSYFCYAETSLIDIRLVACFPHSNNTTWKTNYPGLEYWCTIVKQMLQQRQRKKNNIIWYRCTILNIETDQAWFPIKFPAYYLLICCIERSLSEYWSFENNKESFKNCLCAEKVILNGSYLYIPLYKLNCARSVFNNFCYQFGGSKDIP